MNWADLKTIGEAVAGLGLPAIVIKMYQTKKKRDIEYRNFVKKQFESINIQLNKTNSQLYPNGGSSLFDHVVSLRFGQKNTWEILRMAAWECDKYGKTTYATMALCRMLGCTHMELMGYSWQGKIAHEDKADVLEEWDRSISNGSAFEMTYDFVRPDGMHQPVRAVAIFNKDKNGDVLSGLGVLEKLHDPYWPKKKL